MTRIRRREGDSGILRWKEWARRRRHALAASSSGSRASTHASPPCPALIHRIIPACGLLALAMILALSGIRLAQAETTGEAIAQAGTPGGVPACASCHGAQGQGNAAAGFPRLAGLAVPYIQTQLTAFANGRRDNPVMTPIAKMLSAGDVQAVAAYFARLPGPSLPKALPAATGPGATLALDGRWRDGIPACVSCHGPDGVGVGAAFPPLIGQPAAYLKAQLEAWQQGKRPPGPLELMDVVAKRMTAADITAVTEWFATLTGGAGQ